MFKPRHSATREVAPRLSPPAAWPPFGRAGSLQLVAAALAAAWCAAALTGHVGRFESGHTPSLSAPTTPCALSAAAGHASGPAACAACRAGAGAAARPVVATAAAAAVAARAVAPAAPLLSSMGEQGGAGAVSCPLGSPPVVVSPVSPYSALILSRTLAPKSDGHSCLRVHASPFWHPDL